MSITDWYPAVESAAYGAVLVTGLLVSVRRLAKRYARKRGR
jgi:hypothetical protein